MKIIKQSFVYLCGLMIAFSGLSAQSSTLAQAKAGIQADLDQALQNFADLQAQIREEKIPLSKRLNQVEGEAREKERELERALRIRDARQRDLLSINEDIEQIEENIQYMENLLNDFTRRFEAGINLAEVQLYKDVIEPVKVFMEGTIMEDVTYADVFDAQAEVVTASLDRIEAMIGGQTFEGEAEVPGGAVKEGTFIVVGPVSFFSAADNSYSSLIDTRNTLDPKVVTISPEATAMVQEVAATGTGTLPQDPTQNDALEIEKNRVTLQAEIKQGGVWVWPIIVFFVLSVLIALFKVVEIYSVKKPKEDVIQELLTLVNSGKKDEAMTKANSISGPFGAMLTDAVTFSGDSRELLEEVLYERMLETQPKLERLLPFIAVTAATAPLLGLLGTVTGMINTFQQITLFGTSDASKLAGGISEALVTTKYGLITAIPALIMHAMLARRAQGVMAAMEKYAAAFVNGLTNGSNK